MAVTGAGLAGCCRWCALPCRALPRWGEVFFSLCAGLRATSQSLPPRRQMTGKDKTGRGIIV